MQILFLCGGLGTRLKEINTDLPKGLFPLNGRPFFDYILDSLMFYEPTSFHFCLGYKSLLYLEYIKTLEDKMEVTYSLEYEDNLLGTGGAIKNALNYLDDNFIVQYGDTVLEFDYKKFFGCHLENQKKMSMTILHKDKSNEPPNVFCKKNESNKLTCIYDKNSPIKNSNYIDYGALAFRRSVFENWPNCKFDLSELQNLFTKNSETFFYEVSAPYIEIGNPESFSNAIKSLSK